MGQLDKAYDLVIVGSGGAAFGAAIEARRRDARVAMVEGGTVGGTYVNVGCVPSKTLLAGARAFHTAASHPFAGLPTQTGRVDLAGLVAQLGADPPYAELPATSPRSQPTHHPPGAPASWHITGGTGGPGLDPSLTPCRRTNRERGPDATSDPHR
jgi:Pyridine nucleotide-disulphide oxidoreductase